MPESPRTLHDLYLAVGEKLSGRRICLRFQTPTVKGANGATRALANGWALVDILPGLGELQELKTFLHEMAHVRYHYGELMKHQPGEALRATDQVKPPPGPDKTRRESEADRQAAAWLNYANEHAGDLESKLWALLEAPQNDQKNRV